jgi:type VI secretion system protein ImpK
MSTTEALPNLRSNSLAMAFQDVLTVILRVRYRVQRVADANGFRESIRKMIASATQESRRIGYSDQTSQMALYAIIGFLDESVLNSQDPTFQDWSRRPLQEEMFGGHFAGEYFFRHVNELLNQPESPEVADALELHALCLLLGYRGKFAFGDNNGEILGILRRIRDKITRIRGNLVLCRVREAPAVAAPRSGDSWVRGLLVATALLLIVVLFAFGAYWFLLKTGADSVQARLDQPVLTRSTDALATLFGGFAR